MIDKCGKCSRLRLSVTIRVQHDTVPSYRIHRYSSAYLNVPPTIKATSIIYQNGLPCGDPDNRLYNLSRTCALHSTPPIEVTGEESYVNAHGSSVALTFTAGQPSANFALFARFSSVSGSAYDINVLLFNMRYLYWKPPLIRAMAQVSKSRSETLVRYIESTEIRATCPMGSSWRANFSGPAIQWARAAPSAQAPPRGHRRPALQPPACTHTSSFPLQVDRRLASAGRL